MTDETDVPISGGLSEWWRAAANSADAADKEKEAVERQISSRRGLTDTSPRAVRTTSAALSMVLVRQQTKETSDD
jgi:hypothetical protein